MIRVIGFFGVVLMLLSGTLAYARRDEPEQWIAFISDRDGNAEIYRMRPDGSDVQQLTQTPNDVVHCWIRWSPRSDWIYYGRGQMNTATAGHFDCTSHDGPDYRAMRPNGGNSHIIIGNFPYSIAANNHWFVTEIWERQGSGMRQMIWRSTWDGRKSRFLADGENPKLSPNGQWVVFQGSNQDGFNLYIAHPNGSSLERLDLQGVYFGNAFVYVWTLDSQWIVFGSSESENNASTALHRINVDSREVQSIAHAIGVLDIDSDLTWSPDGKWLAFWDWKDGTIKALNWSSRQIHIVSDYYSPEYTGVQFDWSPDSQWIVFSKMDEAGQSKIWRIHPDGTGLEQLTFGPGEDLRPAWSPVIDKAWNGWELMGLGAGVVTTMWLMVRWRE